MTRKWFSGRENLLFAGLVFLHLIPIWFFKYFPSWDGPMHLENAQLLLSYADPKTPVFSKYYELTPFVVPYWLCHLFLAVLMKWMPPLVAEKIFLSAYTLLLPVLVRRILRLIDKDAAFLAVLIFPFLHSYLYHMGFYAFLMGLVVYCFVVSYLLKSERVGVKQALVLGAGMAAAYFTHIWAYVMSAMAILVILAFKRGETRRKAVLLGVVSFTGLFAAAYFVRNWHYGVSHYGSSFFRDLRFFLGLDFLASYDMAEGILVRSWAMLIGIPILCVIASEGFRRNSRAWPWLALGGAQLGALVFMMMFWAIDWMQPRMKCFIFLTALFLLGAYGPFLRKLRLWIQIPTIILSFTLMGFHVTKYREFNDYLEEYFSAKTFVEPNATVLSLLFPRGSVAYPKIMSRFEIDPFKHAAGLISAERKAVDLSNFLGQGHHGPFQYRQHLDPYKKIGPVEYYSACVDFLTYPQRTGGTVDYVLLWGLVNEKDAQGPCAISTLAQLRQGYDLIFASPKRGLARLYRRKDFN